MHQVRDPTLQAKAGMTKAEWKKKVYMYTYLLYI